jgi:hypothetical protein
MSVNAIRRFIKACHLSVLCIELICFEFLLRPVMERFTRFRLDLDPCFQHHPIGRIRGVECRFLSVGIRLEWSTSHYVEPLGFSWVGGREGYKSFLNTMMNINISSPKNAIHRKKQECQNQRLKTTDVTGGIY